jgi:hypothetical protein
MHKKIRPAKHTKHFIRQFPHCDQRVLHAPGECEYCDMHPDWQEIREAWGIAFTGYEPDAGELPCPATVKRPLDVINMWGGNVPRPVKK